MSSPKRSGPTLISYRKGKVGILKRATKEKAIKMSPILEMSKRT